MKNNYQENNVFVRIIETIRAVDKEQRKDNKGKIESVANWCFIAALGLSVIGLIVLYTLHQVFSLEAETAKTFMAIALSISLILILLMLSISFVQVITYLWTSNSSWDTFANRARMSYPVLVAHSDALCAKFTEDELKSFVEWADHRIRLETRVAILIGAFIAALPKITDLFKHFKNEMFALVGTNNEIIQTPVDLESLPLSIESIAFLVLFFVFVIQFIAFRWTTVHFYVKYAAERLKNASKSKD